MEEDGREWRRGNITESRVLLGTLGQSVDSSWLLLI
jgi:hypothetical protein